MSYIGIDPSVGHTYMYWLRTSGVHPLLLLRVTLLPQRSIKECTLETSSLCEHSSKVRLLMYAFNSHTPPIPNLYLLTSQGRMARDLETMILVKKVDGTHRARYVQQLCSKQLREGEPNWYTYMYVLIESVHVPYKVACYKYGSQIYMSYNVYP